MTDLSARLSIPAPDRITLDDIIAMYEALRPFAPAAGTISSPSISQKS